MHGKDAFCNFVRQSKALKMTHEIKFQYDELLCPKMPGIEVHVVYDCEAEICFDENGLEQSNILTSIAPFVNGQPTRFTKFPEPKDGQQTREFLAVLREAARTALWQKQQIETPIPDIRTLTFEQQMGRIEKPFVE